ncbi:MAG TPA: hypothetical protein VNE63_04540, partial [Candidatus Acidoferrales bacterium]|nr:hypothetical protein [Candidatus Acidoferrales bacterium]
MGSTARAIPRSRSFNAAHQTNAAPTCRKHTFAELSRRHLKTHHMLRSAAIFLTLMACGATALPAQMDDATRQLSRDIFRQLIEINTTG